MNNSGRVMLYSGMAIVAACGRPLHSWDDFHFHFIVPHMFIGEKWRSFLQFFGKNHWIIQGVDPPASRSYRLGPPRCRYRGGGVFSIQMEIWDLPRDLLFKKIKQKCGRNVS